MENISITELFFLIVGLIVVQFVILSYSSFRYRRRLKNLVNSCYKSPSKHHEPTLSRDGEK